MSEPEGTVVDTDVFSLLYLFPPTADSRIPSWREALAERRVVISFQTAAEVLAGALLAKWGARRIARVNDVLERTPTIHTDAQVVDCYVTLTAECRSAGHALHAKVHTGDRWIAACAIAKNLDLLAGDAIYRDAPNLIVRN